MISRAVVLSAAIISLSATACTLVVLGKLGDTKDYPLDDGGDTNPNTSTSGAAATGACSLLASREGEPFPENPCSLCIQSSCKTEVAYACGDGGTKKSWFDDELAACADDPYVRYLPPEAGSSRLFGYECDNVYKTPGPAITGPESDDTHKRESEICVHTNCMTGTQPACRQCPVTGMTGTGDVVFLSNDKCGQCVAKNCATEIVACCESKPVDDILTKCAYTNDTKNLATCLLLADPDNNDAGTPYEPRYNATTDATCLAMLTACFKTGHCQSDQGCSN